MTFDVKDVVEDLDNLDLLRDLIRQATSGSTDQINKTRVASQVYVARCLRTSVGELSAALAKSAEASNRQACGLKWATWILVLATIALFATSLMNAILR
jgi:hypothetical protein